MRSAGIRRTLAGITLGNATTPIAFSAGEVEAAGTDNSGATALPYAINHVTGADGDKGVILPAGSAGQFMTVYNSDGTYSLKVYPPVGGAINGGTMDAPILTVCQRPGYFFCTDTLTWVAIYTVGT